jgi:UDP-N-acetyl-D-galactosamine dehydrogenase
MIKDLKLKNKKICVVGLGYVGLPVALEMARKFKVIGFDIRKDRIELLKKNIDPSKELDKSEFEGCDVIFTANPDEIKDASFYIVAVPTPIDKHNNPDIRALLKACESTGKVLDKGDYVVFESTVYPGCTEDDCIPVIESTSGLKFKNDFKVGYSPERINPGDKVHTFTQIKKVVSGCDTESLDVIAQVYESVVEAGVHKASSIKVAEAAKIIENTQRDINIALMNELSVIFHQIGINTYDVLEAANTKWNFLPFTPGLVGGHCIGVDPYYLAWKSDELGHYPKVILSGRGINDGMSKRIAREVIDNLISQNLVMTLAKVLVMGVTFKENVSDVRNSKVADIVHLLKSYHVNVDVVDPFADTDEVFREYGFNIISNPRQEYNAIIVAVGHEQYLNMDEEDFKNIGNENTLIYDVKGTYRNKIKKLPYMSL